ncbi:hypothetical protein JOF53_008176 [Crossiella equi]|uniref:Secreted protein n=1 Tax=Crossiella equi TaxID=130796 RepID=A0ABS5ASY1_9PSEU|nr:hypothetical protein [Crossiella equi]MBP2479304.1 hypothetical protein [Crossiella equi]
MRLTSVVCASALGLVLTGGAAVAAPGTEDCSAVSGGVQACVALRGGSVSASAFQNAPLPRDCRIRVVLTGPSADDRAATPWQDCFAGRTTGPALADRPGVWTSAVTVRSGERVLASARARITR